MCYGLGGWRALRYLRGRACRYTLYHSLEKFDLIDSTYVVPEKS
ncbi:hypothetical protein [uncultured Bartonella sp.]|nr:hypothetical protein [uncultured Bartonella sp.]